jgi:hypothetical protein
MPTANPKIPRWVEAYIAMASYYRPGAPGDGCGNVHLSKEQIADQQLLLDEATAYAEIFDKEEDTDSFCIGCSDFDTNRAFFWTIEAARLLASGVDGNVNALKLLTLAIEDVRRAINEDGR